MEADMMIPMKSTATNWRRLSTTLSMSLTACKSASSTKHLCSPQLFRRWSWPGSANNRFQHFQEPLHWVPGTRRQSRPGSWCEIGLFLDFWSIKCEALTTISYLMGRTTSITCPNIRLVKPSPASLVLPDLNNKLFCFNRRTLLS